MQAAGNPAGWVCARCVLAFATFGSTFSAITLSVAAASTWNHTLEPLDKKLSKYIGGNPVRLDGKPRASGILDTVSPLLGRPLPNTNSMS